MAAYAAYIEYGDEQLGRVLKYIHTSGLDKNTMIILFTDNGAAGEGAMGGFRTPYHDTTPLAEIDAHLDELGGPNTQPLYQRPWALAGDTPYRRYKVWPYLGGVRTPMMIKWQGHISDPGAIRNQWVEVTDIAPTILEAAGGHFDDTVNGVPQIPVSGVSFFKTIGSRQASSLRTVQFFQLRGNRAIETTDWRAVAFHKNGTRFADDQWELFDLRTDPGEAHDLAKTNPDKVQELKTLWNDEARKYGDLPLKESGPRSAAEFADAFNDD
jgi:arylsulfatase